MSNNRIGGHSTSMEKDDKDTERSGGQFDTDVPMSKVPVTGELLIQFGHAFTQPYYSNYNCVVLYNPF